MVGRVNHFLSQLFISSNFFPVGATMSMPVILENFEKKSLFPFLSYGEIPKKLLFSKIGILTWMVLVPSLLPHTKLLLIHVFEIKIKENNCGIQLCYNLLP